MADFPEAAHKTLKRKQDHNEPPPITGKAAANASPVIESLNARTAGKRPAEKAENRTGKTVSIKWEIQGSEEEIPVRTMAGCLQATFADTSCLEFGVYLLLYAQALRNHIR
jgi:hypothetical protein